MIVYQATKEQFLDDALNRDIDDVILQAYQSRAKRMVGRAEISSWRESLVSMAKVLRDDEIPSDAGIAIEYGIPQTMKRVDFIVTGECADKKPNVIIVELKQWSSAKRTDKDGVVSTFVGGNTREVSHPAYQAWSYAALLSGFNEAVYEGGMELKPCAYLHNYVVDDEITHESYDHYIERAPIFLKGEAERAKLRNFIKRFVRHGDKAGLLYKIENGRIRPSKTLTDSIAKMVKGNKEFVLVDDQKVVFESALALVKQATTTNTKKVYIVEGGPGTGKSVIAVNLLVEISKAGLLCKYVSKNAAPRAVYESKLTGVLRKTEISNLFSGSGAYTEVEPNIFNALIVDEAHRLNEKSGLYQNLGENQVKELINAAKCAVFFLDENQCVTLKDIGKKSEIRKWAAELGAEVHEGELQSQFRCNGSDGYLAWLDNTLQIRETANEQLDTSEFDFKVFDSPEELRKAIVEKNKINNRARMVAGYCWPWNSKKEPKAMDVTVPEHKFAMQWNLTSDASLWIVAPNSVEQIGCIHTCQGLEVDYIGVVVGPDFIVRGDKVATSADKRDRRDKTIFGYKSLMKADPVGTQARIDLIVKNTYRTLMTRGMKGCYVYFIDKETASHFKNFLDVHPAATVVQPEVPKNSELPKAPREPFRRLTPSAAKPYKNCVPLVDLKFAAGAFSASQVIHDHLAWVELDGSFRPQLGLFVAQVLGESMNRRIPNGAWCLFKTNPAGTRNGKVVVAQHQSVDDPDCSAGFTIKVYESTKHELGSSWTHAKIILRPDSSDSSFRPIAISADSAADLRIVAELIAVLD